MKNNLSKIPIAIAHNYTHKDLIKGLKNVVKQMDNQKWSPDIILGITRGGLIPAVMLSHVFNCEMLPINLSLRDFKKSKKSVSENIRQNLNFAKLKNKHVLIVDDILDSGETLLKLIEIQKNFCKEKSLKLCTLIYNYSNKVKLIPDFYDKKIDKAKNNEWIHFSYEKPLK